MSEEHPESAPGPADSKRPEPGEITSALRAVQDGKTGAEEELLELVYRELRRIAAGYWRRERAGHTFQPTELAHEAYLRLLGTAQVSFQDRVHFYAAFAQTIRRLLVDHARSRAAAKRGGNPERVAISDIAEAGSGPSEVAVLDLHDALERLARLSPRQARLVELRYFAGMSVPEAAAALGVGETTAKKDWTFARAWLAAELADLAT